MAMLQNRILIYKNVMLFWILFMFYKYHIRMRYICHKFPSNVKEKKYHKKTANATQAIVVSLDLPISLHYHLPIENLIVYTYLYTI